MPVASAFPKPLTIFQGFGETLSDWSGLVEQDAKGLT